MILKNAVIITDSDYYELINIAEQIDIEVGSLWNSLGDSKNEKILDKLKRLSSYSKQIINKFE